MPFSPAVPAHNNLSGLQGGSGDEYYHLSQAEHDSFYIGWTDLVQPSSAVNPPGGVAAAVYNPTDSTLDFQDGQSQRIDYIYQLPHTWEEGSNVHFHLHAFHSTAGAGNVRWQLTYRALGTPAKPAWATVNLTTVAPGQTGDVFIPIQNLAMPGQKISALIQYQLVRLGADPLDTYAGDVQVISADLHYQIDAAYGSRTETNK